MSNSSFTMTDALMEMDAKERRQFVRDAADRLWVGPERQAWMERDTGQQEVGWLAHAPLFPEREQDGADMYGVVLGVDGRWRWTLDLGIEPR